MLDPEDPTDDPDARATELDDAGLVARIRGFIRRAEDHSAEWRDEARENYDFISGRQWTDDQLAKLREEARPSIVFNRTEPVIEAIAGSQVNNRQETKILPRSTGDDRAAEVATRLLDWARDQCDAEDEESDAFRDLLVTGMGWTETRQDYTEQAEGRTLIERVDPLEMFWDPAARKRNLSDGREYARKRMWRWEDIIAQWPDKEDELEGLLDTDMRGQDAVVWYDPRDAYAKNTGIGGTHTGKQLTLVHYQWCEDEPVVVATNPFTAKRGEMPASEWPTAQKRLKEVGAMYGVDLGDLATVRQTRRRWYFAFAVGNVLLERGESPCPYSSTFKCMTGKRDQNKGTFYGLIRAMKDPQRWANVWLSQSLHILNTSAKSGVLAEEGAIDDIRAFEETWAKAGSVTTVQAGALSGGRIQPKQAPGMPAGFDRLLQFAIGAIPDVTGVNRELLGIADRDQPGILEAQRKQAAQAILAPVFDSLRRYYKEHGRLLLHFIRTYVPEDEAIRIVGEDGTAELVSTAMLKDFEKYDVVVDDAPLSPNAKIEAWQALQPMLPAIIRMAPPPGVMEALLKMSPVPPSVADKMIKAMQPDPNAQQQPDPMVEKAKADAQLKMQTAQLDAQTKMQTAQVSAQSDMQIEQMRLQFEQRMREMELRMEAELEALRIASQERAAMMRPMPQGPMH